MKNSNQFIKYLAFLFFLLFQFTNTIAQYGYFEQGYGTDRNEEGFDLAVTTDYKVMMAGYLQQGTNNKDVYILYTDSIGDTLWTKTVGGNNDDVAKAIWQKDASSFFIAGYTKPNGGSDDEGYFIKHDIAGNVAFSVAIGTADNDYFNDLAQSHEGNMVLVGYTNTLGTNKNIYVVKADTTSGTVLWSNLYGGSGHQEATAVLTKVNGNIVITGTDYSGGLPQAFLLELDSSGNQLTYQLLAQTFSSYANSIAMTRNGKYWLAGYTDNSGNTDALIALVDGSGIYESHQTYGGSNDDKFNSIIRIGNALFMAGSTASYGEGASDLYFVAADSVGNLLFDEYGGGTSTDYANALFHRNGLLYVAGYNSSFGVTESGNMYAARFNVYELAGVIQSTNDLQLLVPIEEDCTMPRVLYVENMYGDTSQVNILGYQVCKWCGNNDFTINESELEDTTVYKGIIGNTIRENRLLDFCVTHGFNQLYFYNSAYLFWNNAEQLNSLFTVNLSVGGSKNLVLYLKERLYKFITEAYKNRFIDYVGLSGARFKDSNDNYTIYFNAQNYNSFANTFNYYNYSFAGKLKQIVLEDEFWKIDPDNPPSETYPHTNYYAQRYQDHKVYLKRMLTMSRNDFNFRKVDDYIARVYNNSEINSSNRDSIELARTQELELIKDSVYNRKYISRFFLVYDLNARWPYIEDSNMCSFPNLNFAIWGRETPYIPWHRDDYAYRTMIFGHRPNNKRTEVYPIFYGMAACLDDRLTKKPATKDDNTLGFWLGVVDSSNLTEQRTLAKAEEKFIGTFSQNTHYNHANKGVNLKVNGFTYFTYELFEIINQRNIANNYTYNFSDNNSTPRIQQNDTFSDNACIYNIPENGPGYYGELQPGKLGKKDRDQNINISAFPNPSSNAINYQIEYKRKSDTRDLVYKIELIDALGRVCYSNESTALNGTIVTEHLKSGVYYLRILNVFTMRSAYKVIFIGK